jgi:ATP-dependent DNA ligase
VGKIASYINFAGRHPDPVRLPDFVEPMKAQLIESMRLGDWIYEIKFDGYRALALRGGGQTRILSRNEKDLGKKFPEIVASIAALDIQDAIIDGEMSRWMIRVVYPSKHSKGSTWAGSGCRSFSTPLTL